MDNYKNRCRLVRRSPKNVGEASLLDRLSKISTDKPINRYKSRAFGEYTRVTPFF